MSIIIVFIIMYIYYLTVYMFCISCYGTNKLLLCDFCTFVQINSIKKKHDSSIARCEHTMGQDIYFKSQSEHNI